MSSDHHGRTARIATRLVRALDEILGTHKSANLLHPAWPLAALSASGR
jgi:hypothetical protein